jgi:hypothetical protein
MQSERERENVCRRVYRTGLIKTRCMNVNDDDAGMQINMAVNQEADAGRVTLLPGPSTAGEIDAR